MLRFFEIRNKFEIFEDTVHGDNPLTMKKVLLIFFLLSFVMKIKGLLLYVFVLKKDRRIFWKIQKSINDDDVFEEHTNPSST